eukprot:g9948.t1
MRRLSCTHGFHQECVDSWLARIPTCPLRCPIEIPNPTLAQRRFAAQQAGDRGIEVRTTETALPSQDENSLEPTILGRSEEFMDMVKRCRANGVNVMVDAVLNHMAGPFVMTPEKDRGKVCGKEADTEKESTAKCMGWAGTESWPQWYC